MVSDIAKVVDEVKAVVTNDVVVKVSDALSQFISSAPQLTVTYTGSYSSPAIHMLLLLRSVSRVEACLFHPKELTYYVVPYNENRGFKTIIYVAPDGFSELGILSDQLRLTGHEFLIITPTTLPKIIQYRLSSEKVLTLNLSSDEERYWLLLSHIINGLAVSKLLNRSGVRPKRLWDELMNVEPVIDNLLSYYDSVVNDVVEFLEEPTLITSTPTMTAVAEYLAFSREIRTQRFLVGIEEVRNFIRFINRILLIETEVEEYSIKEIKGLTLTAASKIMELKLKTDPLTAPIYGLILARIIEYEYVRRFRSD